MDATQDGQEFKEKVDALGKRLIEKLKATPVLGERGTLDFSDWLMTNLTVLDLSLMMEMESRLGEAACNTWLVKVLVESGRYMTEDGENVALILSTNFG